MNPIYLPPAHTAYDKDNKTAEGEEDIDDDTNTRQSPGQSATQIREILSRLFHNHPDDAVQPAVGGGQSLNHSPTLLQQCSLPLEAQFEIVAETVRVLMMVAGKDNPPGRVIVADDPTNDEIDSEEVQSVKDKMKALSEELEEFLICGTSVDVGKVGEDDEDADDILML